MHPNLRQCNFTFSRDVRPVNLPVFFLVFLTPVVEGANQRIWNDRWQAIVCERGREWHCKWLMCGGGGSESYSQRGRRGFHFLRTMMKQTPPFHLILVSAALRICSVPDPAVRSPPEQIRRTISADSGTRRSFSAAFGTEQAGSHVPKQQLVIFSPISTVVCQSQIFTQRMSPSLKTQVWQKRAENTILAKNVCGYDCLRSFRGTNSMNCKFCS